MNFLSELIGVVGVIISVVSVLAIGFIFLRRPPSPVQLARTAETGFVGTDQELSVRETDRQKVLVRDQKDNVANGHQYAFLTRKGQLAPAVVSPNGNGVYSVRLRDYFGRGIGPIFYRSSDKIFFRK